jgi:hypothetical protein
MNWRTENCITMVIAAATIVGAYAFGAGNDAWWGLLFLLNMNSPSKS